MGLGDGLKGLREKLRARVGEGLDEVFGDQPDSAAVTARENPADSMLFSAADQAASGFPSELRGKTGPE